MNDQPTNPPTPNLEDELDREVLIVGLAKSLLPHTTISAAFTAAELFIERASEREAAIRAKYEALGTAATEETNADYPVPEDYPVAVGEACEITDGPYDDPLSPNTAWVTSRRVSSVGFECPWGGLIVRDANQVRALVTPTPATKSEPADSSPDPYPVTEGEECFVTSGPLDDPTSYATAWVRARRDVMGSFTLNIDHPKYIYHSARTPDRVKRLPQTS